MHATRSFLLVVLATLAATQLSGADDAYKKADLERYQKAMGKIWEGTPGTLGTANHSAPYAVIAYSPKANYYGYAAGYVSFANAKGVALARCKYADAIVVVWVQSGYCALAVSADGSAYAAAWGSTRAQAEAKAQRECLKRAPKCHIALSVFSGR